MDIEIGALVFHICMLGPQRPAHHASLDMPATSKELLQTICIERLADNPAHG
jgi:hypothetical protein